MATCGCRRLLKMNLISCSWNVSTWRSLYPNVSSSRHVCSDNLKTKSIWPCELNRVSRRQGSVLPPLRGGQESITFRLYSGEGRPPEVDQTDSDENLNQKIVPDSLTNSLGSKAVVFESEDIPNMSEHSKVGEITSIDGSITIPTTIKDSNLHQLLKNIQEAQVSSLLSTQKTVSETKQKEFKTFPVPIDELVEFLREESAQDICVINIPSERNYVKHFVTCTGHGARHLGRMADNLASELKRVHIHHGTKGKFTVEGRESDDWKVLYLGDTVVHFLTEESRSIYELEKLWTLGYHYDDQHRELERVSLESDSLR